MGTQTEQKQKQYEPAHRQKYLPTTRAHFHSVFKVSESFFIVEIKGIIEMQHLKNTPATVMQNTQIEFPHTPVPIERKPASSKAMLRECQKISVPPMKSHTPDILDG
jgi:hypothetical protein